MHVSAKRLKATLAIAGLLAVPALALSQSLLAASAAQAQPPNNWSYYVRTANSQTLNTLGCNQGVSDKNDGSSSEVILDFGGQAYYNNGTYLTGSNAFVSYATIESLAETFANAYYACTGSDFTTVLKLGIGTNNSAYYVNSTGGSTWGSVVLAVYNWVHNNNLQSQVDIVGANDMEPSWASYSATSGWVSGYASSGAPIYLNYGSTDGCPQTTHNNGGCNNGWNQDDVWYVSWGAPPAYATPEIYYQSQANQWGQIKLWKPMSFEGPLDEYDLNTGTFTSAQAWSALGNAEGWLYMPYSLEIHIAS
jgi:hypothetical protein